MADSDGDERTAKEDQDLEVLQLDHTMIDDDDDEDDDNAEKLEHDVDDKISKTKLSEDTQSSAANENDLIEEVVESDKTKDGEISELPQESKGLDSGSIVLEDEENVIEKICTIFVQSVNDMIRYFG